MDGQEERAEWYVREYRMRNGVCEKTKFQVLRDETVRIGTRRHSRAVNRAEKQAAETARDLARLMNNNFTVGRDCYLTLDYSDEALRKLARRIGVPADDVDAFLRSVLVEHDEGNRLALYLAAEQEARNYMKRLSRACRKAGVDLVLSAYVTSDLDGETFEPERVHHHLVINAEAAELAAACWVMNGGAMPKRLWSRSHGDLSELAAYMIAQVRTVPGKHKYHPSRTLEKPEATRPVPAKNPDAPLRVPSGCEFIWRSEAYAGRPQVLRYYRPPEIRRKNPKKKQGGTHHGKGKQAEH